MSQKTALVIGATGGIGGAVAARLLDRGWHVRALTRRPVEQRPDRTSLAGIEWVRGDAMNASDVVAAARGADLIVHGANPPGYKNWSRLVLPMLDGTIAAARDSGARILLPGTIYNFAPEELSDLSEDAPQRPRTRKGAIRVEMEARLRRAAEEGVRTLIVRAGDFFGPDAGNNWFAVMVKPGKPLRSVIYPGDRTISHAFGYLPDVAEAMVRLVEREAELPAFDVYHFQGHGAERGAEIAEAVRRVSGNPRLPIRSFPWWLVRAASPVVRLFRELKEMRYLWFDPQRLNNAKLVSILGEEPHTPIDQAVRETLVGFGCLPRNGAADVAVND